jgi:hypothetical protein
MNGNIYTYIHIYNGAYTMGHEWQHIYIHVAGRGDIAASIAAIINTTSLAL